MIRLNDIINACSEFFSSNIKRSIFLIGILVLVAIIDFLSLGLARRTFVFYTIKEGVIRVEDRMIKHSGSRENDIIRYTEEALLGPAAQDLMPLFPRETRLKSLLFRGGIVYVDFTSDAAMPPTEGGMTKDNFRTLYKGILRNFSYVKDVRFFIEGQIAYNGVLF
ncbi:MAG: GerMN domain-containing protein [Treponema sp.]|jgi:hypothetical protein|nr:GerMN domain-containing protein [Treponema sp.]